MIDGFTFIFILLIVLVVLIIFAVIVTKSDASRPATTRFWKWRSAKSRGEEGESWVRIVIGHTVENEKYVINNLTLENNGKTSQIDHIVINPRGIFVIETKNYSGKIYGNENQLEWTQVMNYGRVKNKLYNPLKQNATHIYNIKKIIGNLPIRSLVVFVQNNTLNIEANNVIPLSALNSTLNYGENILTVEQMKTAYQALLDNKSDVTLEEHIVNVKEQKLNVARGFCPRCGNKLIIKYGKYGEFWGCSNYPKCKFIKNIRKY